MDIANLERPVHTRPLILTGGRCLIDGAFEEAVLVIEDGLIADIRAAHGRPDTGSLVQDLHGLRVAPGLVDIHGDAFERVVMPRPGVFVPLDIALVEVDRQLAANGITTAYHALTLSWEPGLRSLDRAAKMLGALPRLAPDLTVENRVQLRWETFASEARPLIETALAGPLTPSIAFNDHTSMAMLAPESSLQGRPFEHAPDFPVADPTDPRLKRVCRKRAERANMSEESYLELLAKTWALRPEVPAQIAEVAHLGLAAGAPMLSHDDSTSETRAFYRNLGARVSEFPMSLEAAQAAREAGDLIAFGAPNAMRGGSHIGSPGAGDMIEAGLCDVLASDYYYPALRGAMATLEAEGRAGRAALWGLISEGPARAMGLHDRGRIAIGLRADLVVLDWPPARVPQVRATLSFGRVAHLATPCAGHGLFSQG